MYMNVPGGMKWKKYKDTIILVTAAPGVSHLRWKSSAGGNGDQRV